MTTYAWPFYPHKTYTDNIDLTSRPYAALLARTTAFDVGPVAISDASEGLDAYVWRVRVVDGVISLSRGNDTSDGWNAEIELFDSGDDAVNEISLSFDQNGRPVVAYNSSDIIYLFWYDPIISDYDIMEICPGRTPMVYLDDRENHNVSESDILVFAIQNSLDRMVYFRQRDRYATAFDMGVSTVSDKYFEAVVMGTDRRLYIYYTDYPNHGETCACKGCASQLYVLKSYPYPIEMRDVEELENGPEELTSAVLKTVYRVFALYDADYVENGPEELTSATLRELVHIYTLYDADYAENGPEELTAAVLRTCIHIYTLYDADYVKNGPEELTSTALRTSMITYEIYDDDHVENGPEELTGMTLVAT